MIAALYVETDGVYFGLSDVDPWDEKRDARLYAGPWPVVAHPPCARWSKFWFGSTSPRAPKRFALGDDGGCFAAALSAVRSFGGVLEHPKGSHAWKANGLIHPPDDGGWVVADFVGGWTCRIDQAQFGHFAQKPTWLYAHGVELPSLPWRRVRIPDPDGKNKRGRLALCSRKVRSRTPLPFRDLLLSMARTAEREAA